MLAHILFVLYHSLVQTCSNEDGMEVRLTHISVWCMRSRVDGAMGTLSGTFSLSLPTALT